MNTFEARKNPWSDLILLLAITLGTSLAVQVPVLLVGIVVSDDIQAVLSDTNTLYTTNRYFIYLLFVSSSIGTFLLPAYIFHRMNRASQIFPSENLRYWKVYVVGILFLFSFGPLMSLISEWNMQMKLPDSLRDVEKWMRAQEDNMAQITQQAVMVDDVGKLLLNLLAIAVLPAIGEEFFFRGALQDILKRIFKNEFVAVWIGAIIFSAIHVQFYGFFPRFLLGLFFGYLLVWTRNIWIPVLAHFVNNASVVLLAFYYTSQGKSYAELMASDSFPIIVYLGSFIMSVAIAYWFYRYSTKKQLYGERLD